MDQKSAGIILKTPRLYLREFAPGDAGDLHEILSDAETMRFSEPPYSFEKTQRFLTEFCIGQKGGLAAVQKQSGKVIGYLLFKAYEPDVYELGWFFHRAYWRRGYAYEACSHLIGHAFCTLHAKAVTAETIDRVRSVPLMEKLGMRARQTLPCALRDSAGNWADLYVYEITAAQKPV